LREDVPLLIGLLAAGNRARKEPLQYAEKALKKGLFFESYAAARTLRMQDSANSKAWFFELFAYSFFGDAEDALTLYEEYPERGSADPFAQLLAGRYRLLLRQLNEARTILHTASFNQDVGALAGCELARSYLAEKYYTRAIDAAAAAIGKDNTIGESFLIRGVAQRAMAYESGDRETLMEAYSDFERVAKLGGYNGAEALYHAATVCARLGALSQAEQLCRQSLFQRDRVSPRDALIRVLCTQQKTAEARVELALFEQLAPLNAETLRGQVEQALNAETRTHDSQSALAGDRSSTAVSESAELWQGGIDSARGAAAAMLTAWRVPLGGTLADCALLDDFINRFAPDGDFPATGEFSALSSAGHDTVARVFALHVGHLFVESGAGLWGPQAESGLTLVSAKDEVRIPLEHHIKERILLGASGDNFSSIESLVMEIAQRIAPAAGAEQGDWWKEASPERVEQFREQAKWARAALSLCGVDLEGALSDFEMLDSWIDSAFEPGGEPGEDALKAIGGNIDAFIAGVGFFLGEVIASRVTSLWCDHDKPEGMSLISRDLGRLFPIARVQRRVYLASAADFSIKLSSLAWSVAVASVTEEVRRGGLSGHEAVRAALIERLPSIGEFPDAELRGVVDSLLIGASLPASR
jgi:tetratricopeptide (TPR) repeat protein